MPVWKTNAKRSIKFKKYWMDECLMFWNVSIENDEVKINDKRKEVNDDK